MKSAASKSRLPAGTVNVRRMLNTMNGRKGLMRARLTMFVEIAFTRKPKFNVKNAFQTIRFLSKLHDFKKGTSVRSVRKYRKKRS